MKNASHRAGMSTTPVEPGRTLDVRSDSDTPVTDRFITRYATIEEQPWIGPQFAEALANRYLPRTRGFCGVARFRTAYAVFAHASGFGGSDFVAIERRYAVLAAISKR